MPYVQTGLKDGLLTFECVEIGSAEDEQDKTDLQVGCLTMLLFMLRSLDSCLLKFSIHIVPHDFSHLFSQFFTKEAALACQLPPGDE